MPHYLRKKTVDARVSGQDRPAKGERCIVRNIKKGVRAGPFQSTTTVHKKGAVERKKSNAAESVLDPLGVEQRMDFPGSQRGKKGDGMEMKSRGERHEIDRRRRLGGTWPRPFILKDPNLGG